MQRSPAAHAQDFKNFILRGSLPSVMAGIVLALVTVNLIEALVGGVIGPLITALFGGSRPLQFVSFKINESEVFYGIFAEAALVFAIAILAIYFLLIRRDENA